MRRGSGRRCEPWRQRLVVVVTGEARWTLETYTATADSNTLAWFSAVTTVSLADTQPRYAQDGTLTSIYTMPGFNMMAPTAPLEMRQTRATGTATAEGKLLSMG